MRNFIIGFIVGATLVGTAWAAQGIVLVSGSSGAELGTASNPMYAEAV